MFNELLLDKITTIQFIIAFMTTIFLDTNIFLHFKKIDQIPWDILTNSRECTVIVPFMVVKEIDKKKRVGGRIAQRARQAEKLIETCMDEDLKIRKNVLLRVSDRLPSSRLYQENDLDRQEQDHSIAASIIDFQSKNDGEVFLCSDDMGLRIIARRFNIKVLRLDNSYKLQEENSNEEKIVEKLERKILKLEAIHPLLELVVNGSESSSIIFRIDNLGGTQSKELFVNMRMDSLKRKFPFMTDPSLDLNPAIAILSGLPSLSQVNDYNRKLRGYFIKCRDTFEKMFEFENNNRYAFTLDLELFNRGTKPAENIDIHYHFPDGLKVFEKDQFWKQGPQIDMPPSKPKGKFDSGLSALDLFNPKYDFDISNNQGPIIQETNSCDVKYSIRSLKHSYSHNLESLLIVFQTADVVNNFQLDYKLSADNLPIPVEGKFNVVFEK